MVSTSGYYAKVANPKKPARAYEVQAMSVAVIMTLHIVLGVLVCNSWYTEGKLG